MASTASCTATVAKMSLNKAKHYMVCNMQTTFESKCTMQIMQKLKVKRILRAQLIRIDFDWQPVLAVWSMLYEQT